MALILAGGAGAGLVPLGRAGGCPGSNEGLGKSPHGFDDSDASLLLWVIIFASSATVGDRRGDCHLQWVQDPNVPKALTSNRVKSVIEDNREQRGMQFRCSCRNGSDTGPEKIKVEPVSSSD